MVEVAIEAGAHPLAAENLRKRRLMPTVRGWLKGIKGETTVEVETTVEGEVMVKAGILMHRKQNTVKKWPNGMLNGRKAKGVAEGVGLEAAHQEAALAHQEAALAHLEAAHLEVELPEEVLRASLVTTQSMMQLLIMLH